MIRILPLFLATLLSACTPSASEADIMIDEPWVRETPPGRTVAAGYLTLRNNGDADRALIGVRSPAASRVELHTMTHAEGMMRMRQIERIDVPANSTVDLAPGGVHLMLFDIDTARAGQHVPITLSFDDGWEIEASFPVRRPHAEGHSH